MIDEIDTAKQIENLYNSAAKLLYNLTLFSVGDQLTAERITINAFADTFQAIEDKLNIDIFSAHCVKRIYRYCLKDHKTVTYNIYDPIQENEKDPKTENRQKLLQLLSMQGFKDRFFLLLFCQQKYSARQISKILNLPDFYIKKRLFLALNQAGKYIDIEV